MTPATKPDVPASEPIVLPGRRIHFVGIGGCGMSGLARIAKQAGAICTGSDLAFSSVTDTLQNEGISVVFEQTQQTVPAECDLLVRSAAVELDHPEVMEADRRGLRVLKYAEMLGQLMVGRTGIAIAGTHGKSSTTSMLGHVLIDAGLDPSVIVGAMCAQIGGGARTGQSDLLLAEACEYDRSFHYLHPKHAVVLNIEADHLDIYSSLDEIIEAFGQFAQRVPSDGSLLINHEAARRLRVMAGVDCAIETIGFNPQADWSIDMADAEVSLHHDGACVARWGNPLPGEHMAYNAAVAAVTAHRVGAEWDAIVRGIESFAGLDRRMQRLADKDGVIVIDDYGHHPTEIDVTLRALKRHHKPKRVICVFQPHQHSRTRFLMEEFAASFTEADVVIVPHIYFVRDSEQERQAVRASDLVDRLRQRGVQAMHLYPFDAIVDQLKLIAQPGDLLVTMGAGDVWKIARAYLAS